MTEVMTVTTDYYYNATFAAGNNIAAGSFDTRNGIASGFVALMTNQSARVAGTAQNILQRFPALPSIHVYSARQRSLSCRLPQRAAGIPPVAPQTPDQVGALHHFYGAEQLV